MSPLGPIGLDAVTRLPNGVTWFSTDRDVGTERFGLIRDGDLLSDSGHVLIRNLDLVWSFEPFEDVDNFGLDALHAGFVRPALDADGDGDVSAGDFPAFAACLTAPGQAAGPACAWADEDGDGQITLRDFAVFQQQVD